VDEITLCAGVFPVFKKRPNGLRGTSSQQGDRRVGLLPGEFFFLFFGHSQAVPDGRGLECAYVVDRRRRPGHRPEAVAGQLLGQVKLFVLINGAYQTQLKVRVISPQRCLSGLGSKAGIEDPLQGLKSGSSVQRC
jgi:hypothetical protein